MSRTPEPPASALAGAELADHLRRAWIQAGKPHMERIGDQVGYSKATISKVLSGKMAPAWHLVRKLGIALGVPPTTIADHWHPLWIAADAYRRAGADGHADRQPQSPGGRPCVRCGSWIADARLHAEWHLRVDHAARTVDSLEWASLRDAVTRRAKS